MKAVAAVLVGLVLFTAWRLGVLGVVVAVLVWLWCLAPAPMTVLYAAGVCGLAGCCVYPRYRPGVHWSSVIVRSPHARRSPVRPVSGALWDDQVGEYLARLRREQDQAVA